MPPQQGDEVPNHVWIESKRLLVFPRVPVTPSTSLKATMSSPYCPLNDRRRTPLSLSKICRLFLLLFSCLSLACILILFALMTCNAHSNPGPAFPCSVCAGNLTSRSGSCDGASAPNGLLSGSHYFFPPGLMF